MARTERKPTMSPAARRVLGLLRPWLRSLLMASPFCVTVPQVAGMVAAVVFLWRTNAVVGAVALTTLAVLGILFTWQTRSRASLRAAINDAREYQGVRAAEAILGAEQAKLFRAERQE